MKLRKTLTAGALTLAVAATLATTSALPANAYPDHGDPTNASVTVPTGTTDGTYITVTYTYDGNPAGALRIGSSLQGETVPISPIYDLVRVNGLAPSPYDCQLSRYIFECGGYYDEIDYPTNMVSYTLRLNGFMPLDTQINAVIDDHAAYTGWWPSVPASAVFTDLEPVAATVTGPATDTVDAGASTPVPVTVTGDQFGLPAGSLNQVFTASAGGTFSSPNATITDAGGSTSSAACTLSNGDTVLSCTGVLPALTSNARTLTITPTVTTAGDATTPVTVTTTMTAATGYSLATPISPAVATIDVVPVAVPVNPGTPADPEAPADAGTPADPADPGQAVPPIMAPVSNISAVAASTPLQAEVLAQTGSDISTATTVGLLAGGILLTGGTLLTLTKLRRRSRH